MITLNPQQMPGKLDDERLLELTVKVRDGTITEEEKEELTGGFVKLAWYIARNRAGRGLVRAEEYFSCALFGIAYAIYHAKERLEDQNIAAWIVYQIKAHIQRFRRTDHMVPVPSSTWLKAKKEGRPLPVAPSVRNLGSVEPYGTTGNVYEIKEIISLCVRDDEDRQIVKLRSQSYTDVEISGMMGIPKTRVNEKRKAIESRFDKLISEDL